MIANIYQFSSCFTVYYGEYYLADLFLIKPNYSLSIYMTSILCNVYFERTNTQVASFPQFMLFYYFE